MSESPLGESAETEDLDEDLPDLNEEPDNEPEEGAEYVAGETQDREGTEKPDVNKHSED